MVTLLLKVVTSLIFFVMLFLQKSESVDMSSSTSSSVQNKTEKQFDFRDVVKENSVYTPFVDKCYLRIYGGISADITDVPYQVVIRKGTRRGDRWYLVCGGSIVTRLYVVTAAHCFDKKAMRRLRLYRVVAGTSMSNYDIYSKHGRLELGDHLDSAEVWRKIKYCYKHAWWNARRIVHDLAVLELEYPVTFTRTIQPIPMLRSQMGIPLQDNKMCMVSGYGLMDYRNPSPSLRMVCVPIVGTRKCSKYYGRLRSSQFCAGDWGRDSCQGDSGGPITYKGYLTGIVSFGGRCGQAPGVYTRLTSYTGGQSIPFIRGHCVNRSLNLFVYVFLVSLTLTYNFIIIRLSLIM